MTLSGGASSKHVQSLTKPWSNIVEMKQEAMSGNWFLDDRGGGSQEDIIVGNIRQSEKKQMTDNKDSDRR